MATISEMLVRIGADISDFDKNMSKAEKAVEKIGKKIQGVGEKMSLYLTAPIVGFAAIAIKEFDQGSQALLKLQSVLKSTGKDVESTMQDYEAFASEMQNTALVADDVIIGMLQMAESMGAALPKEAVTNALTLSTALGMGEDAAMRAAIALQQGSTEMLTRYIPALKGVTDESQQTAIMNKFFADNVNIVTDAANSGAGKIKALRLQFADLMESIGPLVMDAITPLIEKLKSMLEWFSKLPEGMKGVIVNTALITAAIGPALALFGKIISIAPMVAGALRMIGTGFNSMLGPIGLVVGGITLLIGLLTANTTTAETLSQKIEHQTDTITALQIEYDGLAKKMGSATESGKEYNTAAELIADSTTIQIGLTDQEIKRMAELDQELQKEKDILTELNDKKQESDNITKNLTETTKTISDAVYKQGTNYSFLNNEISKYARNLALSLQLQQQANKEAGERTPIGVAEVSTAGMKPIVAPDPSEIFAAWTDGMELTKTQWDEAMNYMAMKTQEFASIALQVWGMMDAVGQQRRLNEQIAMDNNNKKELGNLQKKYDYEKKLIVNSTKDEAWKRNNLQALDEKYAGLKSNIDYMYEMKRKDLAAKQARSQKRSAIFQATINAAVAITRAFSDLGPVAGAFAAIAIGALTASQISAINSQPMPMAKGGIISGETVARMGEYRNVKTNPEVVAPLDKLKSILQTDSDMQFVARISGEDLEFLLTKVKRNRKYVS